MANLEEQAPIAMRVAELSVLCFYSLELGLKLSIHGMHFFRCSDFKWNMFDFLLVVLSIIDQFFTNLYVGSGIGTDATFMRSMRVLKLAKIFRAIRLMRIFHELRLILRSLPGSISSLFWS